MGGFQEILHESFRFVFGNLAGIQKNDNIMTREDLVKEVILLCLRDFKDNAWDLLEMLDQDAVEAVYERIKDEIF